MPKKSLKIDKFEGGLVNHYNTRDIPNNSLSEAQDIMVDILGKIRLMGNHKSYIPAQVPLHNLSALVVPGYGLYGFSADYNMNNQNVESELLAIQKKGSIGIYDTSLHADKIIMVEDDTSDMGAKCEPVFFYTNGALRVSDGYIKDVASDGTHSHDTVPNKWFGYINRTLFPSLNPSVDDLSTGEWRDEVQELVDPVVESSNALDETTPGAGTLSLVTSWNDNEEAGEWNADQITSLTFGYSWLYDDEKQETKVSLFSGTKNVDSGGDHELELQVYISNISWYDNIPRRVTGCRIYWMGEGGDLFEDPYQLAEGDFVEGTLTGHNNKVVNFAVDGNYYRTPDSGSGLKLPSQPALTFKLINGYSHNVDSITARYRHAIIANGVTYIANIRQNNRNYHDRMLKSAIGPNGIGFFDVYPSDNFLDVAVQDGDAITALEEFSDRLLQFKRKSLYVINISGDFEYVESHHQGMGASRQSAVCKIANGIAWVNKHGCYIFNGEGVINIVSNKINPIKWKSFVGDTAMIGYISVRQQIVVAGGSAAAQGKQDIYIYDVRTQSWTIGNDKIPRNSKSNFISNYRDTMLFASNKYVEDESFAVNTIQSIVEPVEGRWEIPNVGSLIINPAVLRINNIDITQEFSHNSGIGNETTQEKIAHEISTGPFQEIFSCNANGNPDPLVITMDGHLTDDTGSNDFSANNSIMTFSNPPTRLSTSETFTSDLQHTFKAAYGTVSMHLKALTNHGDTTVLGESVQILELTVTYLNVSNTVYDGTSRRGLANFASAYHDGTGLVSAYSDGFRFHELTQTDQMKFGGIPDATASGEYVAANTSLLNNVDVHPVYGHNGEWAWRHLSQLHHDDNSPGAVLYESNPNDDVTGFQQSTITLAVRPDISLGQGQSALILNSSHNPTHSVVDSTITWDPINIATNVVRIDENQPNHPLAGPSYIAISFQRQVSGDIESQYSTWGNYNDVLGEITSPGTLFSIDIPGNPVFDQDSGAPVLTLRTVAVYTANHDNPNMNHENIHGVPAANYFANRNIGWYQPITIIAKLSIAQEGEESGHAFNYAEYSLNSQFTITLTSTTVNPPFTSSVPYAGRGAKELLIPNRGANTTSDIEYAAVIDPSSSPGVDDSPLLVQYITNNGDTPDEISSALVSQISQISETVGLKSVARPSLSNVDIATAVNSGVYTMAGITLDQTGFAVGMEIELTANTGSGHANEGRFLIISLNPPNTITVNPSAGSPYAGLSGPSVETKNYNIVGSAIVVEDKAPQPQQDILSIATEVRSGFVEVQEFTNNSSEDGLNINNSSSNVFIKTKEFDFGDLSKRKTIKTIYITHTEHEKMEVKCYIDGTESSYTLTPDYSVISDNTLKIVKYKTNIKNVRSIALELTSTELVTNYILNDITIVYREKGSK